MSKKKTSRKVARKNAEWTDWVFQSKDGCSQIAIRDAKQEPAEVLGFDLLDDALYGALPGTVRFVTYSDEMSCMGLAVGQFPGAAKTHPPIFRVFNTAVNTIDAKIVKVLRETLRLAIQALMHATKRTGDLDPATLTQDPEKMLLAATPYYGAVVAHLKKELAITFED